MRKKIGELLVEAGATTADEIKNALGNQRSWGAGQRLGQVLVSMGVVTQEQVAKALGAQFELPFVELPQIASSISATVPLDFQIQHQLVPFRVESDGRVERLLVAVADPSSLDVVDELRFQIGKPVKVYVASRTDIEEVLDALRGDAVDDIAPLDIDEDTGTLEIERGNAAPAPGGYFQPEAQPAEEKKPEGALPDDWDFLTTVTAPVTAAELDQLLTRPALPPPPGVAARPAEVVKFAKVPTPPLGTPVVDVPAVDAAAKQPTVEPKFGGAAAPDAPRFTRASPRPLVTSAIDGGTTVSAQAPVEAAPAPAEAVPPPPPPPPNDTIDFTDDDLAILENLERLASGEETNVGSVTVKPQQMVASLIRLLMKKGVIGETEFLEELVRK